MANMSQFPSPVSRPRRFRSAIRRQSLAIPLVRIAIRSFGTPFPSLRTSILSRRTAIRCRRIAIPSLRIALRRFRIALRRLRIAHFCLRTAIRRARIARIKGGNAHFLKVSAILCSNCAFRANRAPSAWCRDASTQEVLLPRQTAALTGPPPSATSPCARAHRKVSSYARLTKKHSAEN